MLKPAAVIIVCLALIVLLLTVGRQLAARDTVLAWPGGEVNLADCRGSGQVVSPAGRFVLLAVGRVDIKEAFGRNGSYCRLSITHAPNNPFLVSNIVCLVPTQEGKINITKKPRKSRQDWPECIGNIKYRFN